MAKALRDFKAIRPSLLQLAVPARLQLALRASVILCQITPCLFDIDQLNIGTKGMVPPWQGRRRRG
jgi:hypothetical protein